MSAKLLAALLRDPSGASALDMRQWVSVITIARAELLLGTLACRVQGLDLPAPVAAAMDDARLNAEYQKRTALWEADCARRALTGYDGKAVLMKGTAYVAAAMKAGEGRHIGDLDIMVAQGDLAEVERLLFDVGGWEWVREDAYDDAYYRDHMHELPPMIHKERDRMIDVHHTILPLTARPKPDVAALLQDAIAVPATKDTLFTFSPTDMVCHCAAHLIADGDLTGGMRNLWDMHCLLTEFAENNPDFWPALSARAAHHGLLPGIQRAARLASSLYGTQLPKEWDVWNRSDAHYIRRVLARDSWGRGTAKCTRFVFYVRSHWLRMPPMMLAQHLWTKWRKVK